MPVLSLWRTASNRQNSPSGESTISFDVTPGINEGVLVTISETQTPEIAPSIEAPGATETSSTVVEAPTAKKRAPRRATSATSASAAEQAEVTPVAEWTERAPESAVTADATTDPAVAGDVKPPRTRASRAKAPAVDASAAAADVAPASGESAAAAAELPAETAAPAATEHGSAAEDAEGAERPTRNRNRNRNGNGNGNGNGGGGANQQGQQGQQNRQNRQSRQSSQSIHQSQPPIKVAFLLASQVKRVCGPQLLPPFDG
jgi:transcription termination factor Rho